MSHTRTKRVEGRAKPGKVKKPAPKWMREKFHMGSKTDAAMNEGMRRAAERD